MQFWPFVLCLNTLHAGNWWKWALDAFKRTNLDSAISWKSSRLHEKFINLPCALTSFLDTPDDKGLATTAIASSENSFHASGVTSLGSLDIGPSIPLQSKSLCTVIGT